MEGRPRHSKCIGVIQSVTSETPSVVDPNAETVRRTDISVELTF